MKMPYNIISIMQSQIKSSMAKTTPVIPPIVNKKIKPIANNIGTVNQLQNQPL
jgi:hypothetical protein